MKDYGGFLIWKSFKNEKVLEQQAWWKRLLFRARLSPKYAPYRLFTGSQCKFAAKLITLIETDEELKKMMTEIGDKRTPFEQVYFFYKQQP